ncbi:hypothetical protein ICL16_37740 [Iningainema sp. BLCCT55]|uniref:Uncharacterized protein n=1 Tax=Iningainema tapete BLCC-T55 TaxID=2748662 RepID=A0A8J6XU29_9CYAN|nr:hypothetical protein [Iningainema tapete BLCC-T55]
MRRRVSVSESSSVSGSESSSVSGLSSDIANVQLAENIIGMEPDSTLNNI